MSITAYAWCHRSGEIGIGDTRPTGVITFAAGDGENLRQMVEVTSRHAYDGKTYLVPGVPEAANDVDAKDALLDWCDWLSQGERGVKILLANRDKTNRSTSAERFQRTAEMLSDREG